MVKLLLNPDFLQTVVREIRMTEKSIWVAMFEWSWYPGQHTGTVQDLNRELCIKAKSKLDIRVILHNEAIGRALHSINWRTAGHLKQSGAQVKWGNSGYPLHCKAWIFDGVRVILGSHNISVRSTRTNVEVSMLCDEAVAVEEAVSWFNELWARQRF